MSINVDEAFEVEEFGVLGTDSLNNTIYYFTGGSGTPIGVSAPIPTFYLQDNGDLWRKTGIGDNDWAQVPNSVVGGTAFDSWSESWMEEKGKNKWLSLNDEAKGDKTLYVAPFDCVVDAITWTNEKSKVQRDIEIYRNSTSGSPLFTWNIDNQSSGYKRNWKSNGLSLLSFSQGDTIAVFSSDNGKDDKKPVFTMFFKAVNQTLAEGGS